MTADIGKLEVACITDDDLYVETVNAVFVGDYVAVHRTLMQGEPSGQFTVTHTPTGLCLRRFHSFGRAQAFAKHVVGLERSGAIDIAKWRSDDAKVAVTAWPRELQDRTRDDWGDIPNDNPGKTSVREIRDGVRGF